MTPVRVGLDVLVSRLGSLLAGRRVGVLCHQASVTRDLTHAADAIRKLRPRDADKWPYFCARMHAFAQLLDWF